MAILMEHKDFLIRVLAIVAVCVLEGIALSKGVDGAFLKLSFALIGVLAGVSTNAIAKFIKKQ